MLELLSQLKLIERFKILPFKYKLLISVLTLFILPILFLNTEFLEQIRGIRTVEIMMSFPLIHILLLVLILMIIVFILYSIPQKTSSLEVAKIRRLDVDVADRSSRVYEILLLNDSSHQVILGEFEVVWRYDGGMCCSIARGVPIKTAAKYIIELPIDVHDFQTKSKRIDVNPTLLIPPKNNEGPSVTQINVQFHYNLLWDYDTHPRSDWNIYFDLNIYDHIGRKIKVFSEYVWRTDEDMAKFWNGEEDY